MGNIDSDHMEKKHKRTTASGSYRIFEEDGKIKVKIDFSVKKTGILGHGVGAMVFIMGTGQQPLFDVKKSLTVGAHFFKGVNIKKFSDTHTLWGSEAAEFLADGRVAFRVEVDTDTIGIPSWKDLVGFLESQWTPQGQLGGGAPKKPEGWLVKKI